MDKDRLKGVSNEVWGSIMGAVGKVTGDAGAQAEGPAEKASGRAQNAVRVANDAERDTRKN